jgi:hypothetical protein
MLLSDGEQTGPEHVDLLLVSTTRWTALARNQLGISTALRQNA